MISPRSIERSNGEELWEDDWLKPYVFGGLFYLKRLIVARLSGLGNYDRVLEYLRSWYSSRLNGKYGHLYKASLAEVNALDELLNNR